MCLNNRNKQPREMLIPHEIPKHPWMKVATDLFELNDKDYVIVIDYYSKFVEVTRLYNTLSRSVVKALKKIFTIHGMVYQNKSLVTMDLNIPVRNFSNLVGIGTLYTIQVVPNIHSRMDW